MAKKTRKSEPEQKSSGHTLKIIAGWAIIIVGIYALVGLSAVETNAAACPEKVEGNPNASLEIKYFHQESCPYCWKEEPILEGLVQAHPDEFKVSWYNTRSCASQTNKYHVAGTPTLVFSHKGQEKVVRGFLDKIAVQQKLCQYVGLCE